jgi:hypothetical protein
MVRARFDRRWGCLSLALLAYVLVHPAQAQDGGPAVAPPNDECRDSIIVTNGNTNFSTDGATETVDGEEFPLCFESAYADIYHDVYYRYTATCSGELRVDLCNSGFDTKVAVYDGCVCPAPSPPLGCNDDGACALTGRSRLTVPVTQDSCYTIRVGGYNGSFGSGVMNLACNTIVPMGACCNATQNCIGTLSQTACNDANGTWHQGQNCNTFACPIPPPANDLCENCLQLTTGVSLDNSSLGATGDIQTCSQNDTKDVWHCWTADCTGRVRISTCGSDFDTTLAVYDACGGNQLACNDDGCSTQLFRSQIQLDVVAGTTYKIRVAGRNHVTGPYRILVEPCRNACCINGGFACQVIFDAQCTGGGGEPAGPGTLCQGDGNGNGIDDVCEAGCPAATIAGAEPPSGTVDARQPHPMNSPALRQGIGAPGVPGVTAEPIRIQLGPMVTGARDCFRLCETAIDPVLGANGIGSVLDLGGGLYEITLTHAISMRAVTTIEYTGDGSFVQFISHPANTNGNSAAVPSDILDLIDHLNGVRVPPLTAYQCDFNRSVVCTPADIITLVDLLNGVGLWDEWNGTARPSNTTCP